MSTFHASYKGIGELLRSEMMRADMLARAERVKAEAVATAPVSSGQFAASFVASAHIRRGAKGRAVGVVENTDPAAMQIEMGTSRTPEHATLRRALRAAK